MEEASNFLIVLAFGNEYSITKFKMTSSFNKASLQEAKDLLFETEYVQAIEELASELTNQLETAQNRQTLDRALKSHEKEISKLFMPLYRIRIQYEMARLKENKARRKTRRLKFLISLSQLLPL